MRDPSIIGYIDTTRLQYYCYNELDRERVEDFLNEKYPAEVFQSAPDDKIREEANLYILDLPKDNWVIFPVSRKPLGWTWSQLIQAAKLSSMLIVTPPMNEFDSIGIFPRETVESGDQD